MVDPAPIVTAINLGEYLGETSAAESSLITECETTALQLVTRHVGSTAASVPKGVLRAAVREVGADLFHRRKSRNGVTTFAGGEGVTPIRLNRDPLTAAYPILRPFMPAALA